MVRGNKGDQRGRKQLCQAVSCGFFIHCLIWLLQQPCNIISSPSFYRRWNPGSEKLNTLPRATQKQADFGVRTQICLIANPGSFHNTTGDIYQTLTGHQVTQEASGIVICMQWWRNGRERDSQLSESHSWEQQEALRNSAIPGAHSYLLPAPSRSALVFIIIRIWECETIDLSLLNHFFWI